MKIRDVRSVAFTISTRSMLVAIVETDEGVTGIGEAGTGQFPAIQGAIESLKQRLVGEDATRIEHLWQVMWRGGFFPGGHIFGAAVSAIDIALWDLNAKALGVPVYRLLGGKCRDRVPCYTHIGGHKLEGVAESALKAAEEGWRLVRWGIPEQGLRHEPRVVIRESIAGMERIREAVGEDVEVCFDIHARLDPSDAIQLSRGIEHTRPFFIEDPIRSENVHLFRHLRQHIHSPIAAGEHYASKWEMQQLIEEDLIDFVRADLCIVGGLTEGRKVANWAETHQIRLATHNPLGPISAAACMHLSCAVTNQGVSEMTRRPGSTMTDVFPVQVTWEDGYLLPSDRPGLGIEFDEKAARAQPYQGPGKGRMLLRDDGSITNW